MKRKNARLAAVLIATVVTAVSCQHLRRPRVIIYTCPDTPADVIDEFGPKAWRWYSNSLDPWCEGLEAAADAN